MDKPVELIPLVCLRCNTPVPATDGEVAWVCTQCGQGLALDMQQGLVELPVYYSASIQPDATGKPFWVAEGRVQVQRTTYSGDLGDEARLFWNQPRKFVIPAYDLPLDSLIAIGTQYLLTVPQLETGPPASFAPVTFSSQDARSLAEFIVVGFEAAHKDKLKEIDFQLDLDQPVLWVLP